MNVLTNSGVEELEKILDYKFKNKELLDKAFTHSSTANLYGYESNERLEFFGDSILSFIVSETLYLKTLEDEGDLSHIRANLVSAQNLSKIIDSMNIEKFYSVNTQVIKMGFPNNVKADLFESILGAIYLDGGIDESKKFVNKFIDLSIDTINTSKLKTADSKTRLQEYLQSKGIINFCYQTLSQQGPAHNPTFLVALYVDGQEISRAEAQSKRSAEQLCAGKALKIFLDK